MGSTGDSPVPVGDSPTGRARPQLRRSDLFVENGSDPGESPVGAASSASMPLLRSFGFLPFAIYKDTAPLGLGTTPLALSSTAAGLGGGSRPLFPRVTVERAPPHHAMAPSGDDRIGWERGPLGGRRRKAGRRLACWSATATRSADRVRPQ